MIKEAINRILELAEPHILEINYDTYSDKKLIRMDNEQRADCIKMSTLTGLVQFIKGNRCDFKGCNYIVQVVSPTEVRLISALDGDRKREVLAVAEAEIPSFSFGRFIDHEAFLIGVQSKFLDTNVDENDKPLILKFAGTVKSGSVAEYGDTGVTQKATVKTGVASLSEAIVPSPCNLVPFRTFVEVEQPMSSFIFRMKDGMRDGEPVQCALFEADGGAWRNKAQDNIKAYLEEQLVTEADIIVIS